jgi:hypothetical protein
MVNEPATYTHEGDPTNLAAAANDALDWLELFRNADILGAVVFSRLSQDAVDENRARLGACIAALEEHLRPCLPVVNLPRPTDAVAVITHSVCPASSPEPVFEGVDEAS